MKYIIDEKLVNAILGYLANKPYIEVANIIQGMNGMTICEEKVAQRTPTLETGLKTLVEKEAKKYQDSGKVQGVPAVGPAGFAKIK